MTSNTGVVRAYSHRDCLFGALSVEVVALRLLWRRGCWFMSAPAEVAISHQVQQRSLTWACSLSGGSLVPAPVEFTASGLLWWRSWAQACFFRCLWLGPTPSGVPGLGQVLQGSLTQAYPVRGSRSKPEPTEVSGSGLVPQTIIPLYLLL